MTRSEFIANRLQEVLLDGHWIANTNYKEQIENVNREQAVCQIGNLNTIAALTFHINYYLAGILNVLNGGELEIRDKYSFDLPPITSEQDWINLKKELFSNASSFVHHVKNLPDDKLDEVFVNKKYGTYLRNIEGVIEHSYYHLGQITLLNKMVKKNK